MLLQMQLPNGNAGAHEFLTVASATDDSLTFTTQTTNAYASGVSGVFHGSSTAQVIRVPQYTTVDVPFGVSLIAQPWNGMTGGVVALRADSSVTVEGVISAAGAGFQGSGANDYSTSSAGVQMYQGESVAGPGSPSTSNNFGAGGGGHDPGCGNVIGGGGGGYGTAGASGGSGGASTPGVGGVTYGDPLLHALLLGSGSGGLVYACPSPQTVGGAAGGGLIYIVAPSISMSPNGGALLDARGSAGTAGFAGGYLRIPAPGSGGSIFLGALTADLGNNLVTAVSGSAGQSTAGYGRIFVATSDGGATGTSTPAATIGPFGAP